MIYLNKILPVFLLPTGLTILFVMGGLLWRKRWLGWIGLTILWVAATPVVGDFAVRNAERWQVRLSIADVATADAIVVLSGMLTVPPGDSGMMEWADSGDRYFAGVNLYAAGKAPKLFFTRGWVPWQPDAKPEGEILGELAQVDGVPAEAIEITDVVMNTSAEAQAVAAMLDGAERRVILVTSAYHMARSVLLFEQAGLAVVPFPVDFQVSATRDFSILDLMPSANSLAYTEGALREFYGYLFYWLAAAI